MLISLGLDLARVGALVAPLPPAGFVLLVDGLGAYLVDADGTYLMEAV